MKQPRQEAVTPHDMGGEGENRNKIYPVTVHAHYSSQQLQYLPHPSLQNSSPIEKTRVPSFPKPPQGFHLQNPLPLQTILQTIVTSREKSLLGYSFLEAESYTKVIPYNQP